MKDVEYLLKCESMGQHNAVLSYTGPITRDGALMLSAQFERLFGYYQYENVVLKLESPGGEAQGLDYLLRVLAQHTKAGKAIVTSSTFLCASAAAVLLALGKFGTRSISPQTQLLFHQSRVQGEGSEWTASSSTMLTKALTTIDRRIVDTLTMWAVRSCDSEARFVDVLLARIEYVERHWVDLAPRLVTLTSPDPEKSLPDWLKAIKRIVKRTAKPADVVVQFKRYLADRFQREQAMHALEAFVLCLVDDVRGVIQSKYVVVNHVECEVQDADRIQPIARAQNVQ